MDWSHKKGKFFTQTELANFTEGQYIVFLRFCEQFMVPSPEGPRYANNPTLWRRSEEILAMPDHPFAEHLWRINIFSSDKKSTYRKFFFRQLQIMNTVLKYIQRNPAVVTEEMKKIMELYPRFAWALTQTEIKETAIGTQVLIPKEGIAPYEQRLASAAGKTINLLERLVDSIKDEDIKKMSAKDKLLADGSMGYLFTIAKSIRPNRTVFQQINIHGADRDTLEKTILQANRQE